MSNKAIYQLVNWAIAGVFGLMFIYTGLIAKKPEIQMECYYEEKFNVPCPTCGLTRGFSMIFKGNLKSAEQLNRNSIPLFCFFSFQLFMRLGLGIWLCKAKQCSITKVLTLDIIISTFILTLAVHNIIIDLYRR